MRNKESMRNWGVVLLLILLAGSATLIPTILDQFSGSTTRVESEVQTIEINFPITVMQTDSVTLTTLQIFGILAGIVTILVIGAGVAITFAYTLLSRQVATVVESDAYQEQLKVLSNKEKEKNQKLRENRSVDPVPDHEMPRWSVVSTALIILFFVVSFAMLINGTFVPEGEYLIGDTMVNSSLTVVGGIVALALAVILWRLRPKTLAAIESTNDQPVPWDFIWVLLTGMLVVGLGIGLMVYLNVPG